MCIGWRGLRMRLKARSGCRLLWTVDQVGCQLLDPSDYELVIEAHRTKAILGLEGDLVLRRRSLQLLNARLTEVIQEPFIEGFESESATLYV